MLVKGGSRGFGVFNKEEESLQNEFCVREDFGVMVGQLDLSFFFSNLFFFDLEVWGNGGAE